MNAVLNFNNHSDHIHYDHDPRDIDLPYDVLKDELVHANNCGRLLGNGSFGNVYEIVNTDQVLKVCSTSNLKADAYHSFLQIPLSQSSNPFLPKVEKFIKYRAVDKLAFIVYGVKMERLYSLDQTPKAALEKIGIELITDFTTGEYYRGGDDPGFTIVCRIKQAYNMASMNEIKNLDLIEALQRIKDIHKNNGHYNDMGKSNFMIRETLNWNTLSIDYHLVITDPLS